MVAIGDHFAHAGSIVFLVDDAAPGRCLTWSRRSRQITACKRDFPMNAEALKRDVCAAIDTMASELIAVSHYIHENPELNFKEFKSSARLQQAVKAQGLPVTSGAYNCKTGYESEFGKNGAPVVAILSEYDALPGIGHSCGHNVIGAAGLGAALGLAKLGNNLPGRVRYLGTPAEEGGGGKEVMAQAGAFNGVDAAMMVHSSGFDIETMPCLALTQVDVIYHGLSSHASAMPHRGLNALDAVVLAYQGIAALRQHIRPTERIHGIITDGGQAANIVPERAAAHFLVRAENAGVLMKLKQRVHGCLEAGAMATGVRAEINWSMADYLDLKTSWPIARCYRANAEKLGRVFMEMDQLAAGTAGSTDMGNVSYRVPSIHPMIAIAPANVVIHNPEFARWAKSDRGDKGVIDGAKAMAMTAIDFFCDPGLRDAARKLFEESGADASLASGSFRTDGKVFAAGCACC